MTSQGRRRTASGAVAIATVLLIGGVSPAFATAASDPPPLPVTEMLLHPLDDYAGAQVRRYEGGKPLTAKDGVALGLLPQTDSASGLDVSGHQGTVVWQDAADGGADFAYIKATEGTAYINPYFTQQYNGAYATKIIRGAYHFATPDTSDGTTQANFFLKHGGGWSADGLTLPPALDLEYDPYGPSCYGLSPQTLVTWIHEFVNQVHTSTGRYPVIYTSTKWWSLCTANDAGFSSDPLWIPRYGSSVGTLPAGWTTQAFWQFADSGPLPGDQDSFNGAASKLHDFATASGSATVT